MIYSVRPVARNKANERRTAKPDAIVNYQLSTINYQTAYKAQIFPFFLAVSIHLGTTVSRNCFFSAFSLAMS